MTCVNCGAEACQSHSSGWVCYGSKTASSVCGCATYDAYGNCIANKSCWQCAVPQ